MISYWAVLSAQFRALLQYRAAAIAGLGTQVFWGLIRVMIFQAFFRSTTAEQPMEVGDVLTYVWLSQAFLALLPWNQDNDLRALIRTGGVGYELLRPVDLYGFWYCRSLAFRIAPTALRAAPLIAFAGVFMGLVATPYRFCLGHIPAADLPLHLAHQLVWALAIVLIGRWMLSLGLRRLVIQGG